MKNYLIYIEDFIKKRIGETVSYLFFWFRIPGLSRLFRNKFFLKLILNFLDIEVKQNLIFTFSHRNLLLRSLKF